MKLSLNDVKSEDRGILSPCGIACLGCDSHLGEGLQTAKKLKAIWDGSNFLDTATVMRLSPEEVKTSIKILDSFIISGERGLCPGCSAGSPMSKFCGIAQCVESKGFWTCAECSDYNFESNSPCPHISSNPIPMADKGTMSQMICSRYNKNTINNLKRCQEIGYSEFIKELKVKVDNGWRTWQVISDEMVFTNATKK